MLTTRFLIAITATVVAGMGCGYKGPLYLPPDRVEAQPVRIPVPPEASVPEGIPSQRPVPSEAAPPPK